MMEIRLLPGIVKLMSQLIGLFQLIRPINCAMMGFAVIIGELIALSGLLPPFKSLLGFPVAFLLTAATMSLNDYFDRSIDAINNPKRPIPSGVIKPRSALILAIVCSATGIIISNFLNLESLIIASISLVLMVYYNTIGKKTGFLGNVIVSICVSLPFIFGGYAVQNMRLLLWIFVLMSFFSNLGREATKGIVDIEGDKKYGVKTLTVIVGPYKTTLASSAFFICAIVLSLIPIIFGMVSIYYLPTVIAANIGFSTSILSLLKDHSIQNARVIKNRVLIWMAIGLIAFLLGNYGVRISLDF